MKKNNISASKSVSKSAFKSAFKSESESASFSRNTSWGTSGDSTSGDILYIPGLEKGKKYGWHEFKTLWKTRKKRK